MSEPQKVNKTMADSKEKFVKGISNKYRLQYVRQRALSPVLQADEPIECFWLSRLHGRRGNLTGREEELEKSAKKTIVQKQTSGRSYVPAAFERSQNGTWLLGHVI